MKFTCALCAAITTTMRVPSDQHAWPHLSPELAAGNSASTMLRSELQIVRSAGGCFAKNAETEAPKSARRVAGAFAAALFGAFLATIFFGAFFATVFFG